MLKLIASDIDGTLMPYGQKTLSPALFGLIRRLRTAGILFCPASGRQYHSMRTLFAPVANEVCFLCENGGVIFGPGGEDDAPVLSKTAMSRPDAMALSHAIMDIPGCEVLISGQNISYVCGCGEDFVRRMEDLHGNLVAQVDHVEDISEDILKVTAFCPGGLDGPAALLGPRWGGPYHMAEAGPVWLDFGLANKGTGLRGLCGSLGIDPAETAAFGDNWNDVPMLEVAGTAWLMSTAAPALRERFPRQCGSVLETLEAILRELPPV